jgi:hypothetical protein
MRVDDGAVFRAQAPTSKREPVSCAAIQYVITVAETYEIVGTEVAVAQRHQEITAGRKATTSRKA